MKMESQLSAFENYVTSLSNLGVFPSFHRHSNGWTCILRNSNNKQIMPFNAGETCWGETMMNALTAAVNGLNHHFTEPKELHRYIDTGVDSRNETFQTVKSAYAQ
jgi:hypothetical protein